MFHVHGKKGPTRIELWDGLMEDNVRKSSGSPLPCPQTSDPHSRWQPELGRKPRSQRVGFTGNQRRSGHLSPWRWLSDLLSHRQTDYSAKRDMALIKNQRRTEPFILFVLYFPGWSGTIVRRCEGPPHCAVYMTLCAARMSPRDSFHRRASPCE